MCSVSYAAVVCVSAGSHHLTSPPSQAESLLAMFDPLSSAEGVCSLDFTSFS